MPNRTEIITAVILMAIILIGNMGGLWLAGVIWGQSSLCSPRCSLSQSCSREDQDHTPNRIHQPPLMDTPIGLAIVQWGFFFCGKGKAQKRPAPRRRCVSKNFQGVSVVLVIADMTHNAFRHLRRQIFDTFLVEYPMVSRVRSDRSYCYAFMDGT